MVGSSGPCPGPWLRLVLPAQLQAQHDGPKGDVILLPGVQPFSKQLLASSVGVCQGKRNLLWATVLSGSVYWTLLLLVGGKVISISS